ncbi:DNA polymerase IV [Candidatus Uhrbacteria bacterium]|nr:DNA polymerase IV [Candidatus Uhrbacteria bacterium]
MSRIILHIDMNSYFASVEQQANPFLRGKPLGITGKHQERSVIAAASIEAKKLGVKTAMSTWEAKRICPSLILYPGDPEKYSYITSQFNSIFSEYTNYVEQFSIDECFLDLSKTVADYLEAIVLAQTIRERIKKTCGEKITCSIGIAPNKLIAKLCSEQVKPNGITTVCKQNVLKFLDTCKLRDLCGIGNRIENRLGSLGINTFDQLRKFPLEKLVNEFNSYGYWLHESAHGLNDSPVINTREEPKSIGHSYTLSENTEDKNEMKNCLLGLSDRVAWRLRNEGFVARCVHVIIRYSDFTTMAQQQTFTEPTSNGLMLFKIAWQIIEKWLDVSKPVRLLGLSASTLSKGNEYQSLFKKERKVRSLQKSLDKIQNRYGSDAWTRASLIGVHFKKRSSGFHSPNSPSTM